MNLDEVSLFELLRGGRPCSVRLGRVEKVYRIKGVPHVDVRFDSDGRLVKARPVALGGAVRVAIALGDEALVLLPESAELRAVALVGLENGRTAQTQDVTGVEITHPDGTVVRLTRADQVEPVVKAPFVDDVKAYHDTLLQVIDALLLATVPNPALATSGAPLAATLTTALNASKALLRATSVALQSSLPADVNPYKATALRAR